MIRSVLIMLVFTIGLAGCTFDYTLLLSAVRPLQNSIGIVDGIPAFTNRCTASLINTERRLWLTAAHCLAHVPGQPVAPPALFIAGQLAEPVLVHVGLDLAVLSTTDPIDATALRLASHAPAAGDWVGTAGYPLGIGHVFVFAGTAAAPVVSIPRYPPFAFFGLITAPGQSGSPIVNQQGALVSIMLQSVAKDPVFDPIVVGATWESLKTVVGQFWEE